MQYIRLYIFCLIISYCNILHSQDTETTCDTLNHYIIKKIIEDSKFDNSLCELIDISERICGINESLEKIKLIKGIVSLDTQNVINIFSDYYLAFFTVIEERQNKSLRKNINESGKNNSVFNDSVIPMFDKWVKTTILYPCITDLKYINIVDLAKLLIYDSLSVFRWAVKNSKHRTVNSFKELVKLKNENKIDMCWAGATGIWSPFGNSASPDKQLFFASSIGMKYKSNSFEAQFGGINLRPSFKLINSKAEELNIYRIYNLILLLSQRFDFKYNREIELALGGGITTLRATKLNNVNNNYESIPSVYQPTIALRCRFYFLYNYYSKIRLGIDFNYQYSDYNNAHYTSHLSTNFIFLGIVLRY